MKRVTEKNMIDYLVKIKYKNECSDINMNEWKFYVLSSSVVALTRNEKYELSCNPYNFFEEVKNDKRKGNPYKKAAKILLNDINFFKRV